MSNNSCVDGLRNYFRAGSVGDCRFVGDLLFLRADDRYGGHEGNIHGTVRGSRTGRFGASIDTEPSSLP